MRVLIADRQRSVRSALRLLIDERLALEVVGEAAGWEPLLNLVRHALPDLVILDWELVARRPGEALAELRSLAPGLMVVVMSGKSEVREAATAAGADAFLCKGDAPERSLAALQAFSREGAAARLLK